MQVAGFRFRACRANAAAPCPQWRMAEAALIRKLRRWRQGPPHRRSFVPGSVPRLQQARKTRRRGRVREKGNRWPRLQGEWDHRRRLLARREGPPLHADPVRQGVHPHRSLSATRHHRPDRRSRPRRHRHRRDLRTSRPRHSGLPARRRANSRSLWHLPRHRSMTCRHRRRQDLRRLS